ncbi:MAG: RnfABCDGE type electron transport complex subunit B [Candidatus Omnitrophica bacterium]|nr:RnfABCDGE type electron transport complex subunit B [Candidatus Omnitrophota bacterium]
MIAHILTPVIAMAGLGLVFGVGLAYALKLFKIEVDPTTFMILSKLPGSNCGACGKAGCAGFAEALKKGEAMPAGCAVSNDEARSSIAELLGVEYKPKVKTIATVFCNGGVNAKDKYIYKGIKTCKAASLVFGGQKACSFGCLGFGDCVTACPFDAIKMTEEGLPEVDPNKCTACGICVKVCPKELFVLTPTQNKYYVKCKSTDPGSVVAKVCKTGCIACRKCEKACPIAAIKVESNLARIYYDKCQNIGECFKVCPTKVIAKRG